MQQCEHSVPKSSSKPWVVEVASAVKISLEIYPSRSRSSHSCTWVKLESKKSTWVEKLNRSTSLLYATESGTDATS